MTLSQSLAPCYGSRQRWTGSSRRNPCPVCGRAKDDQCRRSADLISCYRGSTHHPPELRLGQVLLIDGQLWAVVNLSGGFAGNSVIFKPHADRSAFKRSPALRRKVAAAVAPELRRQLARIRRQFQAVMAARDPYWLSPDQLKRDHAIAAACLANLQSFLRTLHGYRRDVPEAGELVAICLLWIRAVSWQLNDPFPRWALGEPSARQIEALAARQEVAA